mmetsp:Transcript_6760/g.13798  ORF Transcript_6760/g.13798 Transcript_6760/m.13798 type:complete len:549 (-) Transcript_6760:1250-2896(-)
MGDVEKGTTGETGDEELVMLEEGKLVTESDGNGVMTDGKLIVGQGEKKFARALASSDRHVREKALEALTTWLEGNRDLEDLEMMKLWKGLFYCIWMADKVAVQEQLTTKIVAVAGEDWWPYYRALWSTMRREWYGIDRLRIDKYYSLLTKALRHGVSMAFAPEAEGQWNRSRVEQWLQILKEEVFDVKTNHGKGVTLHVLDKWVQLVLIPSLSLCQDNDDQLDLFKLLMDQVKPMILYDDLAISRRGRDAILGRLVSTWMGEKVEDINADLVLEVVKLARLAAISKSTPEPNRDGFHKTWVNAKALAVKIGIGTEKLATIQEEDPVELQVGVPSARPSKKRKASLKKAKQAHKKVKKGGSGGVDSSEKSVMETPQTELKNIRSKKRGRAAQNKAGAIHDVVKSPPLTSRGKPDHGGQQKTAETNEPKAAKPRNINEQHLEIGKSVVVSETPSVEPSTEEGTMVKFPLRRARRRLTVHGGDDVTGMVASNEQAPSKDQKKSNQQSGEGGDGERVVSRRRSSVRFSLENNQTHPIPMRKQKVRASKFLFY